MQSTEKRQDKDVALEALRGLAALAVVFAHNRGAFLSPETAFPQLPQIFQIFIAGGSAVIFFFVLSGLVLTRKFVATESKTYLLRSALKRYFRLLGPALLSCLISALLFRCGWYHYAEVANLIRSPWLSMFGYAIPGDIGFKPSLPDAFRQGAFYIYFVSRHQYYNSALWTMYYETIGSFLIFAIAFGAVMVKRVSSALMAAFWMLSLAGALYVSVYYAAFICGLGLTLLFSYRKIILPRSGSIALIVLAVLLLSFVSPTGEYAALTRLGVKAEWSPYFSVVGSVFLIVGVEASEAIRQELSGRIGVFLGKLSFPIYLVHFLVLASLGCFVWLRVNRVYGPDVALVVAFVASVSVAVVASLPFMVFDRWWTFNVNRAAEFVVKRRHGEARQVEAALPR